MKARDTPGTTTPPPKPAQSNQKRDNQTSTHTPQGSPNGKSRPKQIGNQAGREPITGGDEGGEESWIRSWEGEEVKSPKNSPIKASTNHQYYLEKILQTRGTEIGPIIKKRTPKFPKGTEFGKKRNGRGYEEA